jgi:hypothetical protein
MSKVKAVLDFYKETLPKKAVELADLCEEVGLLALSGEYTGKFVANAGLTAVYADHVTAELSAEIARLRTQAVADAARIAELERVQTWLPIETAPRCRPILVYAVWDWDGMCGDKCKEDDAWQLAQWLEDARSKQGGFFYSLTFTPYEAIAVQPKFWMECPKVTK